MLSRFRQLFRRKPKKYLVFRFSDPIDPLREGRVIEETETTYLIRILIYLFDIPFPNWEVRIPKNHPCITEVFTR